MITGIEHDCIAFEDDSLEAVNAYFHDQRWTDGHLIAPPTVDRVEAMLSGTSLPAGHVLGRMPPALREVSLYYVAVNAVMAGCLPAYFPAVIAGLEAILEPSFNLLGLQVSVNPAGVMLMANGPVARELNINGEYNVLGQGWRANMAIGRAVRLCMVNIGGAYPGISDMSTHGNPIKLGICFAENEDASPWEPLHVERGFPAASSTMTAFSCIPQHVIVRDSNPAAILDDIAGAILCPGSNAQYCAGQPSIIFGPVHAGWLAKGGFDKVKIRSYLWDGAKIGAAPQSPDTRNEVVIAVAGGSVGRHTIVAQTFKGQIVTAPLRT